MLVEGWYAFIGPKGFSAAQVAYWDETLVKTTQSPDWKKFVGTTD